MIPDPIVDILSTTWPGAVILASLQGGVALLIVWIICRLWRTLPPAIACWLWRLAYLKLILALLWTAPLRLPLLPPEPPTPPRAAVTVVPTATLTPDDLPDTIDPEAKAFLTDPAHPERPLVVALAPVGLVGGVLYLVILGAVGFIWLTGVLIGSVRLAIKAAIAVRLRRRARPVDDPDVADVCAALAAKMGLRRAPRVLVHDDLAGPLLVGVIGPAILLPAPVPAASGLALRQVLAHELAHLRRRDLAWNLLAAAADVLFFFHPLVWLARRDYRLRQEAACDAEAVAATGSAPADYAGTLIAVAARGIVPAGPFSAGVVDSRKSLERRILAMSRSSNWSPRRRVAAAFIVILAAILAVPPWRVVAQEKPPTAQPPAAEHDHEAAPTDPATSTKPPPTDTERAQQAYIDQMRKRQQDANARGAREAIQAQKDQRDQKAKDNAAAAREALQAQRGVESTAYLVAQTVRLQAPADGVVQRIAVRNVDRAKKGDVLIELDPRRARAALAQAEAKLQMAKAQWQRVAAGRGDQNPSVLIGRDEMAAQVQIAEAEIELRRQDVEETKVLAPFDGAVRITAQPGQRVSRAEQLGQLTAVGDLRLSFHVGTGDLAGVKVGQAAGVEFPVFPGKTFKAEITEVAPVVDPNTGTVDVFARITDPTDGLLPGMNGTLTIPPPAK